MTTTQSSLTNGLIASASIVVILFGNYRNQVDNSSITHGRFFRYPI